MSPGAIHVAAGCDANGCAQSQPLGTRPRPCAASTGLRPPHTYPSDPLGQLKPASSSSARGMLSAVFGGMARNWFSSCASHDSEYDAFSPTRVTSGVMFFPAPCQQSEANTSTLPRCIAADKASSLCGRRSGAQCLEPLTTFVAPFSGVNSSMAHIVLRDGCRPSRLKS